MFEVSANVELDMGEIATDTGDSAYDDSEGESVKTEVRAIHGRLERMVAMIEEQKEAARVKEHENEVARQNQQKIDANLQ